MWWQDLLWGLWNGLTAWIVFIVHVFSGWDTHAVYNAAKSGNWYDFGFLLGAGSPFLGTLGAQKSRTSYRVARRARQEPPQTLPGEQPK